ncbi:protein NUCLEAR FUSION DEFECTIVE 4-like [Amaranthus tricolor]|uniref:protein NUCLEAR FUSION DEFECTIVE 4-like n=1 Tax=Amaranthus tricolor TaxID=29722 RepID=UPI00258FC1A8|nr:protein NUCLEAR FUSION DEFECTIVE 4-like [Amaranthus tricolor]
MVTNTERLRAFFNNRWLVFVASMWVQSVAGVGYLFGSISPIIKGTMGYNQKQISYLGVVKNLGDCIGFAAGALSEILPFWGVLLVGVLQNFFGYGFLWLIISNKWTSLPLWVLCIAIFVGNNGETYYNTAALVSCVLNFPDNRGSIVGILKGFSGLSGAILSQTYHIFSATNRASLILTIAVCPSIVVLTLMFAIRFVDENRQKRPSDKLSFSFVYGICLILAAYLMGSLLLEDHMIPSLSILCSIILLIILLLPLIVPITLTFSSQVHDPIEETLIPESRKYTYEETEPIMSDEERRKRVPKLGENHTFKETLLTTEFWLMFVSLILGSGCGITIIDNMGQICESLGYSNTRIFVSIISICNFLGRVVGGYFSELVVRHYAYPRLVALAIVQFILGIGLLYYTMGWPASIYTLTVLTSLGYGAHWAILPAAVSEMFGLKSFGALYNLVTLATPIGSFVFSSGLASRIYDYNAEEQAKMQLRNEEDSLTCMGSVCYSQTCAILCLVICVAIVLSLIVVRRTRCIYKHLYEKL